MGMSSAQALKVRARLAEELHIVFSRAIREHHTHEHTAEQVRIVLSCEKLPKHAMEYLRSVCDTMRFVIYNHHLVWMKMLDGELLTTAQVDALTLKENAEHASQDADGKICIAVVRGEECRSPWQRVDMDASRHVWKDSNGQPLRDKSYDAKFR